MSLRSGLLALFLSLLMSGFSQGPRTWQDHTSMSSCNTVTRLNSTIYASYGNGIVQFNDAELAPQSLNKINKLSDVGVRLLRANPYNNKVLVIYENANIDVIDEAGNVTNYPDFKLKTMSGKKLVNEVTFDKQIAYLACGFGIVVFDTEKLEIKETFYIGSNASELEVLRIALTSDIIFAATANGLLQADRSKELGNYKNWKSGPGLPSGYYNGVVNAGGIILACRSVYATDYAKPEQDTVYEYVQGTWVKYSRNGQNLVTSSLKMGPVEGDLFSMYYKVGMQVFSAKTGSLEIYIAGLNGNYEYGSMRDALIYHDYSGNRAYWCADAKFGLFRTYFIYAPQQAVNRDGLHAPLVSNIDILGDKVAVSPSRVYNEGTSIYTFEGLNFYQDGTWSYLPSNGVNGQPMLDINSVFLDRKDQTMMWATSYSLGVVEYKNNKPVREYTHANAGLDLNYAGMSKHGGLNEDADGNIWLTNSESYNYLGVIKRSTRKYQGFQFDAARFARRTIIDRNGNIWLPHERESGLTVFRHHNFASYEFKVLSSEVGKGNLGTKSIYAVCEDKDGRIWVGTDEGIRVIYNPANIFDGGDYDAQPIKITQDGNVELLLGSDVVTAIVVDGANNKWVGTESGGVYCFSPDGITQLYHFTKENSPLYSNTVGDLNYDERTGDLFIATDLGLQSFRSTVIAGADDYSGIYAFPNPVRPGYTGTVLIRGLVDNTVIKVTDVAGNIVWEAQTSGGQAEWPLINVNGSRVTSGVYLVYASTPSADQKAVTKVMVMN